MSSLTPSYCQDIKLTRPPYFQLPNNISMCISHNNLISAYQTISPIPLSIVIQTLKKSALLLLIHILVNEIPIYPISQIRKLSPLSLPKQSLNPIAAILEILLKSIPLLFIPTATFYSDSQSTATTLISLTASFLITLICTSVTP